MLKCADDVRMVALKLTQKPFTTSIAIVVVVAFYQTKKKEGSYCAHATMISVVCGLSTSVHQLRDDAMNFNFLWIMLKINFLRDEFVRVNVLLKLLLLLLLLRLEL